MEPRSRLEDTVAGALYGLLMGVYYSAVYGLILIAGRNGDALVPQLRGDLSTTLMFGVYLLGGILAGAIAGFLRPIAASIWGAMSVGSIAVFPVGVFLTRAITETPVADWTDLQWVPAVGCSILLGSMGGAILWWIWRS